MVLKLTIFSMSFSPLLPTPFIQVEYRVVDLASFSAIHKFAEDFKSSHTKLDILVNNAGVVRPPKNKTEQGIEATIGINYLGHFFLTHLLRELLISVQGRVVMVASKAYEYFEISLESLHGDDPQLFKPVDKPEVEQYCKSNIARVMYARELVKRYPEISCASLHPGTIDTQVYRSSGALYLCIASCMRRFWKTPEQGAQTSIYCATADLGDGNGGYYVNSALRAFNEKQVNEEVQCKLWEVSMGLVEKYMGSQD